LLGSASEGHAEFKSGKTFISLLLPQVEYMLVSFDHENRKVQLLLNGGDVLETLQEKGERTNPK
jgi:hypothetical protein